MNMSKISIIIPVLNEAANIQKTLHKLPGDPDVEIIVIDGGSQDQTVALVQTLGVKVMIATQPGRAYQMNLGASIATGDILLFLHADTQLPPNYQELIKQTVSTPKTIAGAFQLTIDSEQLSLKFIAKMVNMRSRFLSLPYGDQAIFLYASVFREVGGFAELPIMEDFELIQRLKRQGKIALAPASVITSDRRWRKLGVFRTTWINQLIILGYYLGVSPNKLARFYR